MTWVTVIMEDVLASGKVFLQYSQSAEEAIATARQRVQKLEADDIPITSVVIGRRVTVEELFDGR